MLCILRASSIIEVCLQHIYISGIAIFHNILILKFQVLLTIHSSIVNVVPDVNQMIGATPTMDKNANTLGRISSMMGGGSNKLQEMAGLASSFKQLGMPGDMLRKFVPIILDCVQNKGGDQTVNLVKGALI